VSSTVSLHDIGLTEETGSELSPEHAVQIGATVNATSTPGAGDALPLLWHWAYFTPTAPTSELGTDGHPVLPDGPLSKFPRRMWASGSVEADGDLVVGTPATRTSRILDHKESEGRSGALFIVRVEHRYRQFDVDRIVEQQTLVYREAGPPIPLPVGNHRPEVEGDQWQEDHLPDTATLFRFSSITFNSHRIHYDEPYATSVEGYPALVVHGPLTALLVGESIRRRLGRALARFEFRANAPLFVNCPFSIIGTPGTDVSAHVVRNDGTEAMKVTATLRD
jgi:3-methylfumaryl-CoA hydratase